MNLPKPTRRDFAAAVVGAIALALVFALLGLGPWRYTVAGTTANDAPACYILDTWTGRARFVWGDRITGEVLTSDAPSDAKRAQRANLGPWIFGGVFVALVGGAVFLTRRNS